MNRAPEKAVSAQVADDLIYLVSCAVNDEAPDAQRIGKTDTEELFSLSEFHMLTAAVALALERTVPLPHDFDQALKKAIRKLALFEVERAAIAREFESAGIRYMPLKGILLKDCYPKSAMRQMTDNDILTDGSRMNEVRAIMERLGYSCDSFGELHHDVYSKPPTLEFEMHRTLFSADRPALFAEYFADIISRAKQDGCACRMSDEDLYLYILCHTYKHYSHGGTGLRSLLDLYVFLRSHPGLDREYLGRELEKLRLVGFEQKMSSLAQKTFSGARLNEKERLELDYLLSSGSGGTLGIMKYNKMARELGNDDSDASKRRYLKNRVFISGEALQKNYPFVARHRALYPLLLVYRPVKGAVRRPKELIGEYKRLKRFKRKD